MLELKETVPIVKHLSSMLDTPHIIGAISINGDKYHYGLEVSGLEPPNLLVFALNLLYLATDHQVLDDEVLRAIQLIRKTIGEYGGKVEPPTEADETP